MNFQTSNFFSKSKLSSKDIFDYDFLKEKDDALKPLDFLIDSIEIENEALSPKKEINEKPKNKLKSSSTFNSNIIIVDSESVNSNELTFNNLVEKEIEKLISSK